MTHIHVLVAIVIVLLSLDSIEGVTWSVSTKGKLLKNGVPTYVHGVSLSCTEFDSPIDKNKDGSYVCPMIDQNRKPSALFQALPSKWNAQIVRIPVNSQWYMWDLNTGYPAGPSGCKFASLWAGQTTPYGPWSPQAYRDWIDDHVNAATSLGMVALIDLHWSDMDGTACCDNGASGCTQGCQQTMADHKSLAFWQYVATKYNNRTDVWFEAYNEPAYGLGEGNSTEIPLLVNGGTVTNVPYKNGCPASPLSSFTFVGMQDIYNTIRYKVGSDNIIVVGGADWSWSWNGVLVPPRQPLANMSWCNNIICQRGCGIEKGIDYMIASSPRGEGYPAPVSWSTRKWGKNVVYNTHPYQAKGGQAPTTSQTCSSWVNGAIYGSGSWICDEQCGWDLAFGFLTDYVPVIATELGPWPGFSCDGSYVNCQLAYFASKNISFTPWAYWGNPAAQCNVYPTLVNSDWSPNGYGLAVQAFMTSH